MVVVGRVTLALLGTRTTRDHARLDRGVNQTEVGLGLTGHDPAGGLTHVGAVEIETNTPHQLGHVGLAEAGVGAAGARGGAVEALVNAAQQHIAIQAERPRMALDDCPDCHIPSVQLGSSGRACEPILCPTILALLDRLPFPTVVARSNVSTALRDRP